MKEIHEYAKENKVKYPVGSRLVIIKMADDRELYPCLPGSLPAGLRGTVQSVDDCGQVCCHFDNGEIKRLNHADQFRPLASYELEEEESLKKDHIDTTILNLEAEGQLTNNEEEDC